ncbi:hypothetical protein [Lacrimispora sp.]|uniref:hypothetical protein n=1 Tax=Lacrimispora sp. TaxID=2719234 RepID=UPI0028B1FE23|nr:hypothetical protein [Lacrimispora sp.]
MVQKIRINTLCEGLLKDWSEKLLTLQISHSDETGLYGGILCPACARIHGRCFEAIYPFLYLADTHHDLRFLDAAKRLFEWAEQTVSRPDGSYVNDMDCDWQGTTVFSALQLAEALTFHGHILDGDTRQIWMARLDKAAKFLYHFEELNNNNINYCITNALTMLYCGELLNIPEYKAYARNNIQKALDHMPGDSFLFGEGYPTDGRTPRGCRAVDIGYNVEESLPALAACSTIIGDTELENRVTQSFETHLHAFLPDGGWNNSFGTRNYKWTYWGSRTSDGSAFGLLLLANHNPAFAQAAYANLQLLRQCTHGGLLYGGPHYHAAGERACVHHTFTHAKVLADILNHELSLPESSMPSMVSGNEGIQHFADIDSYFINCHGMLASITANDWEYISGGHASGGNITMLWHHAAGPILCASVSQYLTEEPPNMQLPRFAFHECISPALKYEEDGICFTSLYDFDCVMSHQDIPGEYTVHVLGQLPKINHVLPAKPVTHESRYIFQKDSLRFETGVSDSRVYYQCPLISKAGEFAVLTGNQLVIRKELAEIILTVEHGQLLLPHGLERCYNLVPGLQAIKAVIVSEDMQICFNLKVNKL